MLIGFRAAYNKPATEEFLVVQFLHRAFRFLDGLHLHKCKTFRALVVPIAYHLCVLHVSNAVEQFEEIALSGVERQIANVETWRCDFNPFRLGTLSVARDSSRVESNLLQALCGADGNSASSYRE